MAEPLLQVRALRVAFRTPAGIVTAVDGISFEVAAREVLALVGESGSGKTLSMLALLGLVTDPAAIVSGSVRLEGRELIGLPRRDLRRLRGARIAMVFQDPSAMTPVHGIGWQVAEQIRAHQPLSRRAARARAIELLALTGIPDPAAAYHRYPHQLSGGMRQRAMIAMALSCDPALLIADEPTTALDTTVQAQILALLDELRRAFGSAIVLVTHDMGVVAELADRVMVMYAGQVVERGAASRVLRAPAHPYTRGLLAAIPPIEGPRPHRLAAIPGMPPGASVPPSGCAFAPRCAHRFAPCGARPTLATRGATEIACFADLGAA